jgi:surfeit locus 1 family protein
MTPAPRSRRARLLAAFGAALLCAGFAALGSWQLQRLQWKRALIAQVDQRVHAAPAAAPSRAAWSGLNKDQDEYRRLRLSGHFLDASSTLVQASTELGSGYWLLTPFCADDGAIVMVNRGFLAPAAVGTAGSGAARAPDCGQAAGAAGIAIAGLLRMSEPGGGFLRHNAPAANRWYSRDVAAIGAARGLPRVAPYFLDQDAAPTGSPRAIPAGALAAPVGGLTVISFNNNHLVYALTWYAMGLMAAGACAMVLREGRGNKGRAN